MRKYLVFVLFSFLVLNLFSLDKIQRERALEDLKNPPENYNRKFLSKYLAEKKGFADYRDEEFDAKFYDISISIDFENEEITGAVIMKAEALQDGLESIDIDLLDNMTVLNITDLAENGLTFSHENDKILITLDRTYNIGEIFNVKIYYSGTPINSGAFQGFTFETHGNGTPFVSTLSEPYGSKSWWPCKDNVTDKADSIKLHINVPTNFKVATNGMLQSVEEDNNRKTYNWTHNYPITTYLVAIAATDYVEFHQYWHYSDTDSMLIQNFTFPENYDSASIWWTELPEMLDCFTERYGMYPFVNEKYGMNDFQWGGAMEHQTMTAITQRYNGTYSTSTIAHELAHQWFGDKITCSDWHNLFINEGFATYSQAVYFEYQDSEFYPEYMNDMMSYAMDAQYPVYIENVDEISVLFNYNTTYLKGATILHMLRGILGTDVFWTAIKTYANDENFIYKNASIRDFLDVCEEVSGQDLDYFYDEWFFQVSYPHYRVTPKIIDTNLIVRISQTGDFYSMPLDLEIKYSDNTSEIVKVFNDEQNQDFTLPIAKGKNITEVVLDPQSWVMKYVIYDNITPISDHSLEIFLGKNYPNPFNPKTTIKLGLSETSSDVELSVYNLKGEKVKELISSGETYNKGIHEIIWNGTDNKGKNVSSGIYFYIMKNQDKEIDKKKMLLIK